MAPGGAERPGKVAARYDALTGGRNGRATYYLLARRLKILPSQFDAEPWWSQRLLLEEMKRDLEAEEKASRGKGGKGTPQRVDAAGDLSNSPFNVKRV